MSGVSTRTIQRIERGKTASLESLKCLAAVFETEISNLQKDTTMNTPPLSEEDRAALSKVKEWMQYDDEGYIIDPSLTSEEREALEYVRDIKAFYGNLLWYVAIMALLLAVNLFQNPGYLWVIWPALGWGIGIAFHALSVFEIFSPFGADWEKKQIKKRLRRK